MGPLSIAQYMIAAVFFTVALLHLLVWSRRTAAMAHLLFALASLAAGGTTMAEASFYRAETVAAFNTAFRWSNTFGALWAMAILWFVVIYTEANRYRQRVAVAVTGVLLLLLAINNTAPYGILYGEITGLRPLLLPWGEQIVLAMGRSSVWSWVTDAVLLTLTAFVGDGCVRRLWRSENRQAAALGLALAVFIFLFGVQGRLVDIGALPLPYLFTYGFLAVTLVMSYDLAGGVVRAAVLSERVTANERRWRTLLEQVPLLVVGVDRQGRIDYVNPFVSEMSGFDAADLLGQPLSVLASDVARNRGLGARETTASPKRPLWIETPLRSKAGMQGLVVWSDVVLYDQGGHVSGSLSVGADVTEQRRAESARDRAIEELERALCEVETLKVRLEDEVIYLQDEIKTTHDFQDMIGDSDALKYVMHRIEQVAALDTTVLIEGETGVGKELVARTIHSLSPRSGRALIKVNCAALPAHLIEAELFGHEKGAFTNAIRARKGRFELANGGTLFLDEVGELPLELQPKLLRVLQEGALERIGSDETARVDVRIIAATNRRLQEEVKHDRFRDDLYYRLHVYPITVPPLRQRKDDLPLLVQALVQRFARAQGKQIDTISTQVMAQLHDYDWPGNIRELENVIERAVITTPGTQLRLAEALVNPREEGAAQDDPVVFQGTLEEVEKQYIRRILQMCDWRIEGKSGAAHRLGLNPSTLRSRLRKWGIKRPQASGR